MSDTTTSPRRRVEVFELRVPDWEKGGPDPLQWPLQRLGVMLAPEGEHRPGGEHNKPLGIVEVPRDADVSSLSRVLIDRPRGSCKEFSGVPTIGDEAGVRYHLGARTILDIASRPDQYEGLGITLVADYRGGR